jgi:hypothetical protein
MVTIKVTEQRIQNRTLEVEAVAEGKRSIFFLEETLKTVELDSPHPGMDDERVYARFVYFSDTEPGLRQKFENVRGQRMREGWEGSHLSKNLFCGGYELHYKIQEIEVFE